MNTTRKLRKVKNNASQHPNETSTSHGWIPSSSCLPPNSSNPSVHTFLPGFIYHPNFLTPKEEQVILEYLNSHPWKSIANRLQQQYGYLFHHRNRSRNMALPSPNAPCFLYAVFLDGKSPKPRKEAKIGEGCLTVI